MTPSSASGRTAHVDSQHMRLVSYSDNAEDVLLMRAFHDQPSGTFVDVGAGHPTEGSVVKNLSDLLHWRGVHIEPDRPLADLLEMAYPDDVVIRSAMGSQVANRHLVRVVGQGGMSTMNESVADQYHNSGMPVELSPVTVDTLESVLERCGIDRGFEVLKIDVEGSEGEVLGGLSLERWRPLVLLIEVTFPGTSDLAAAPWTADVMRAGYDLALFDGLNRYFVLKERPDLYERLSVPANVFDRFVPYRWYERMPTDARPDVVYHPW